MYLLPFNTTYFDTAKYLAKGWRRQIILRGSSIDIALNIELEFFLEFMPEPSFHEVFWTVIIYTYWGRESKKKYIWVIPREIYNSKFFSHETFVKMFFKQFKSIRIFLFRCYMKNVIVMNFFRFAA